MFEWFKVIDPDKVRFKRRKKVKVAKVGDEGPELWPSDLEAGPPILTIPKETDPEVILNSRKMQAAGDGTLKE